MLTSLLSLDKTKAVSHPTVGRRSSEPLDEAYVPFFGAFGAAWDDAMVARWSGNPLGMLWSERDAAAVLGDGDGRGPPAAARRPVVIIAAG